MRVLLQIHLAHLAILVAGDLEAFFAGVEVVAKLHVRRIKRRHHVAHSLVRIVVRVPLVPRIVGHAETGLGVVVEEHSGGVHALRGECVCERGGVYA